MNIATNWLVGSPHVTAYVISSTTNNEAWEDLGTVTATPEIDGLSGDPARDRFYFGGGTHYPAGTYRVGYDGGYVFSGDLPPLGPHWQTSYYTVTALRDVGGSDELPLSGVALETSTAQTVHDSLIYSGVGSVAFAQSAGQLYVTTVGSPGPNPGPGVTWKLQRRLPTGSEDPYPTSPTDLNLPKSEPTVTITAAPDATTEGDTENPGKFYISRDQDYDFPLTVGYDIDQAKTTASPSDYFAEPGLSGTITIPAGKSYAEIDVTALSDGEFENTETLDLQLLPPSSGEAIKFRPAVI